MGGSFKALELNYNDPLNLIHKGGTPLQNLTQPWKDYSKTGQKDPTVPAPSDPVTPAVTMQDPSVMAAQQDYAMMNARKKSFADTIYAGDTGGFGKKANAR